MLARILSAAFPSRRLSALARKARARTLARYASAAGYLPYRFLARSTSLPEGAYRARFADGGGPLPRSDAYRVALPAAVACSGLSRVSGLGDMLARCSPVSASAAVLPAFVLAAGGVL